MPAQPRQFVISSRLLTAIHSARFTAAEGAAPVQLQVLARESGLVPARLSYILAKNPIGPSLRARLERLGDRLGVPAAECVVSYNSGSVR